MTALDRVLVVLLFAGVVVVGGVTDHGGFAAAVATLGAAILTRNHIRRGRPFRFAGRAR